MILELPLYANPNRTFKILLSGQECTITLRQKGRRMYFTLYVQDTLICRDAVCLDMVPIIQVAQSVFKGNFVSVDVLGSDAPQYDGLGTRFFIIWYDSDDDLDVLKNEVLLSDNWQPQ